MESTSLTAAPVGKATAQPDLLDKNTPGAGARSGSVSTTAAFAQIGAAVVVAGVVTWFGVPLIASVTQKVFETTVNETAVNETAGNETAEL